MTRRFYLEGASTAHGTITITGELAHRMARVLRLQAGADVLLFDGSLQDVHVRLADVSEKRIVTQVIDLTPSPHEPRVGVHLYQSITKGERFEWLVEKATELGVRGIVPLLCARSVVKTGAEGNRIERWRRIAVEAAEQCERGAVPEVGPPVSFDAALSFAPGILLMPYESAHASSPNVQSVLSQQIDELFSASAVSIFVGPEGGYEDAEVERAIAAGAHVVTLGDRVLRSETAGLVALTLVMSAVGELG